MTITIRLVSALIFLTLTVLVTGCGIDKEARKAIQVVEARAEAERKDAEAKDKAIHAKVDNLADATGTGLKTVRGEVKEAAKTANEAHTKLEEHRKNIAGLQEKYGSLDPDEHMKKLESAMDRGEKIMGRRRDPGKTAGGSSLEPGNPTNNTPSEPANAGTEVRLKAAELHLHLIGLQGPLLAVPVATRSQQQQNRISVLDFAIADLKTGLENHKKGRLTNLGLETIIDRWNTAFPPVPENGKKP